MSKQFNMPRYWHPDYSVYANPVIEAMIGVTMRSVEDVEGVQLIFTAEDGRSFVFHHEQDCCEFVRIEEIIGELTDLVGAPITMAEEISSEGHAKPADYYDYSYTWTFYKFATAKGYVTVRWLGESNGYYSEAVYFGILPAGYANFL